MPQVICPNLSSRKVLFALYLEPLELVLQSLWSRADHFHLNEKTFSKFELNWYSSVHFRNLWKTTKKQTNKQTNKKTPFSLYYVEPYRKFRDRSENIVLTPLWRKCFFCIVNEFVALSRSCVTNSWHNNIHRKITECNNFPPYEVCR